MRLDVADPASFTAFIGSAKQTGPISLLVNNAGIQRTDPFAEQSLESQHREIDHWRIERKRPVDCAIVLPTRWNVVVTMLSRAQDTRFKNLSNVLCPRLDVTGVTSIEYAVRTANQIC